MKADKGKESPIKHLLNPFKEIKALSRALTKGSVYFARTVKNNQGQIPEEPDSLKTSEIGSDKGSKSRKKEAKEGDSDDSFGKAQVRAKKLSEQRSELSLKLPDHHQ